MSGAIRTTSGWAAMIALAAAACGPSAPAFETYASETQGFSIAYPQAWEVVRAPGDERVWFVPPGRAGDRGAPHLAGAEFLLVFTVPVPGPLADDEARRLGLGLLPIHGVSGFRRFRDEGGAAWHRFEVTGTAGGTEWASVGLLVSGRQAVRYVVCAKPLTAWREGQRVCDDLLRTFTPGDL